ncbi:hypothetical protein AAFF_G00172910 [Aldrovandia affinis]|uniref:Uncharacterized protein n=1 Tax=Aldrovandia affinis TaxID=143900 RepID=A0AAD7WW77_9TELE|nr:hypothetical protein AAFF_G00172910 [Aldrovandia affinis]
MAPAQGPAGLKPDPASAGPETRSPARGERASGQNVSGEGGAEQTAKVNEDKYKTTRVYIEVGGGGSVWERGGVISIATR